MATVRPGAEFRLECREWFDGTIGNNDSAQEVRDVEISMVHPLSGPIAVEGATPVPQETGPVAGQRWGYTGIFARVSGGGFLAPHARSECS